MSALTDNAPPFASLILDRGGPHAPGTCFALPRKKILLGRSTSSFTPDISFDSLLVSRKHCYIDYNHGAWAIGELKSKHGTLLNGEPLQPGVLATLKPGDRIGLAADIVKLRFAVTAECEQTIDYQSTSPLTDISAGLPETVTVDTAKHSLLLAGTEVALSAKEWLLLELLYRHRNRLVPYDAIRSAVWSERPALPGRPPDVGLEEINLLLFRLRRKLGNNAHVLKTRRGAGCLLEIG